MRRIDGASTHLREVHRSAYLRHSYFLNRFSGSTGFPLLFSLSFQLCRVLYIKRCFPLKLDLNLPDQSQFHKTPTACPPYLQVCYTYSLPTAPTACPPYLQPARHTYRLPATPTACPPHLQPARHTYSPLSRMPMGAGPRAVTEAGRRAVTHKATSRGVECRLRGCLRLASLAEISAAGASRQPGAGRQQIALDERGRDASPD